MKEQANDLLNAPSPKTLSGTRDRAVLALLLGCGLRRAELLRIDVKDLQQREGRWVLPDMAGKGGRVRTVTIPAGVKSRIDAWPQAYGITEGALFRPITKAGVLALPYRCSETFCVGLSRTSSTVGQNRNLYRSDGRTGLGAAWLRRIVCRLLPERASDRNWGECRACSITRRPLSQPCFGRYYGLHRSQKRLV
ncbi:phage integrase family protein [Acidisarcina polymorpha]|uniref:Phage integrase family protein n=1 Tax=Acidisarcina polymorpha TaxID=2211140 RepID=A0A2Z5FUZ1_9BACT|nr:tyrosine-type recombinase/integrase [Acidisarcina polymorpha]AXC10226.1 phage integrase family protein [Acidisarcina polymorpha]